MCALTMKGSAAWLRHFVATVLLVCGACPGLALAGLQPVAIGANVATLQGMSTPVVLRGIDFDTSTLTYSIAVPPAHGQLSGTAPNLTYAPAAGYGGWDRFVFKVSDGATSSTAAIDVFVQANTAQDDSAVAFNRWVDVPAQSSSVQVTLGGADHESGATSSYRIGAFPLFGELRTTQGFPVLGTDLVAGTLVYVPTTPGFTGFDSFTYYPSSWSGPTPPPAAYVTLQVNGMRPPNRQPLAMSQVLDVYQGSSQQVTLFGQDAEGAKLAFLAATGGPPQHGTGEGTLVPVGCGAQSSGCDYAEHVYTPNAGFTGADVISFRAYDGVSMGSMPGFLSIRIHPLSAGNDAPIAMNQTVFVEAGAVNVPITLLGEDADGDSLTFDVLPGITMGQLAGSGAYRRYTAPAGFTGSDSIAFTVSDGASTSLAGMVNIQIKGDLAVNDPPIAHSKWVVTHKNTPAAIALTGKDFENQPLALTIVQQPASGTLTAAPGQFNFTYAPNHGYEGEDKFTFRFSDGTNLSNLATVHIAIGNSLPVADDDAVTTARNTPVTANAASNDTPSSDGGSLWSLIGANGGAAKGTVTMTAAGSFTYTPNTNANGADAFSYRLCDGDTPPDCDPATVTVTITGVDEVPVANDDTTSTTQGTPVTASVAGNDVLSGDGGNVWTLIGANGGAAKGTVTMNPFGTFTYTPNPNASGIDTFAYQLCDGDTTPDCDSATVTVVISSTNGAPVAQSMGFQIEPGEQVSITLQATDPNPQDVLTFSLVPNSAPRFGQLTGTPPNLIYVPNADFIVGMDSFRFVASDGTNLSNIANVSIGMPFDFVTDQTYFMALGYSLDFVVGPSQWHGQPLRYSVGGDPAPALGQVSGGTAPERTYTPTALGEDSMGVLAVARDPANQPVADVSTVIVHVLSDCSTAGGDTDGDGHCDLSDPDDDNDGVDDPNDPCPLDPLNQCVPPPDCSAQGGDTDGDGICNNTDPDDDNDGVDDPLDPCPLDPLNQCVPPPDCSTQGGDTDGDGICNNTDPDDDNDGVDDPLDPCPLDPLNQCVPPPDCSTNGGDTDGDGICNNTDPDDDNDGVDDPLDPCPLDPLNQCVPPPDCSANGGDTDGDGICDATDPDDDNDGVTDPNDPCPLDPLNQCVPPPDCSANGGGHRWRWHLQRHGSR